MSEMASKKRMADSQLTRDNDGEDNADDEFVTTPQIADESEMATRRVVKVRRPESSSTATSSGGATGFFKNVAGAPAEAAPAKPAFGFGFGTGGSSSSGSTSFSFGAAPAKTDAPKPTFGFPTATTTTASSSSSPANASTSFSFGSAAPASTSPGAPSGFSFGAKTESSASDKPPTAAPPMAFSFGAAPPPPTKSSSSNGSGFNFGFSAPNASTSTAAPLKPASEEPAKATTEAEGAKPLFGAGGFNFGSAVNTFVAARSKMQEDAKDGKPADDNEAEAKDGDADADEKPDPAGFGSEIVEQTARDVLATAPSKLYLFESGEEGKTGRWVERGTGDAKLISQPKSDDASEHVYRLLVRGGYSLNATIKKNTFSLSKTEAKHLILVVATAEGPHTYLLKFTGPSAETNTKTFSEELKKVVEEVSKVA